MSKSNTATDEQLSEYIEFAKVIAEQYSEDSVPIERYAVRIDGDGDETVVIMFSGEDLVAYTAMVISMAKHELKD